jgi:hypothetical protein
LARETNAIGGDLDEPEAQHGLWRTTTERWRDNQVLLADDRNKSGVLDPNWRDQKKEKFAGW